jgi:ParB/RepB/Spo0J family partition protein
MDVKEIKLSSITGFTENHRLRESESDVSGLMASIKETGLINPITVKKVGTGYRLVAGFRRFMAHKKLRKTTISAHILDAKSMSDSAINLVENIQREETPTYEIGRGIHRIMTNDKMSIKETSVLLGISVEVTKKYLTIYKETPAPYRDRVMSFTKGHTKLGYISNSAAVEIINMRKEGKIDAKEKDKLFREVSKGMSLSDIKSMRNKPKNTVKTGMIYLNLCMSKTHMKKLGDKPHDKIRKLLEDTYGVKILNKAGY